MAGLGIPKKTDGLHKLHGEEVNKIVDVIDSVLEASGDGRPATDKLQLAGAIDDLMKQSIYENTGSANNLLLTREGVSLPIESLSDGMTINFIVDAPNTGSVTAKVNQLSRLPVKLNGLNVPSNFIVPGVVFSLIYDLTLGYFKLYKVGSDVGPNYNIDELKNMLVYTGDNGPSRLQRAIQLKNSTYNTKGMDLTNIRSLFMTVKLNLLNQASNTVITFDFSGQRKLPDGLMSFKGSINYNVPAGLTTPLVNSDLKDITTIQLWSENDKSVGIRGIRLRMTDTYIVGYLVFSDGKVEDTTLTIDNFYISNNIDINDLGDKVYISRSIVGTAASTTLYRQDIEYVSHDTEKVNGIDSAIVAGGSSVTSSVALTNNPKSPFMVSSASSVLPGNLAHITTSWLVDNYKNVTNPAMIQRAVIMDDPAHPRVYVRIRTSTNGTLSAWYEVGRSDFGTNSNFGIDKPFLVNKSFSARAFTNRGGTYIRSDDSLQLHAGELDTGIKGREAIYKSIYGVTPANIKTAAVEDLILTADDKIVFAPKLQNSTTTTYPVSSISYISETGVYVNGGSSRLAEESDVYMKSKPIYNKIVDTRSNNSEIRTIREDVTINDQTPLTVNRLHIGHYKTYNDSGLDNSVDAAGNYITGKFKLTKVNKYNDSVVTGAYVSTSTVDRLKVTGETYIARASNPEVRVFANTRYVRGMDTAVAVETGASVLEAAGVYSRLYSPGNITNGYLFLGSYNPTTKVNIANRWGIRTTGDVKNQVDGYFQANRFIGENITYNTTAANIPLVTSLGYNINRITNQGGLIDRTDSSRVIHAGEYDTGYATFRSVVNIYDNGKTTTPEKTIQENLILSADGNVLIGGNRQDKSDYTTGKNKDFTIVNVYGVKSNRFHFYDSNVKVGTTSGRDLTTGINNSFIGNAAGLKVTTGGFNTFTGAGAGTAVTIATHNTFNGAFSGNSNTTGVYNTFVGSDSGKFNTTGSYNAFTGSSSGIHNTSGVNNVYNGYQAGYSNTTTGNNTFVGSSSGYFNKAPNNTFIGNISGYNNTTGTRNVFIGAVAGYSNTTGIDNTFTGYKAGYKNTTGANNVFAGTGTGYNNTTGSYNTFNGRNAGYRNTTGTQNTFNGYQSGYNNTTGNYNTFNGYRSGYTNTTGIYNTFTGVNTGYKNTTGKENVFVGTGTGYNNTTGSYNTFTGRNAGRTNTTGNYNTFNGKDSGYKNATGSSNTFNGYQSGYSNTTGHLNTFNGYQSGYKNTTGSNNIFNGYQSGYSNTTGYYNVFIGNSSGYSNTTGKYNTFTGLYSGYSNTTGIYNTFTGAYSGFKNTTGNYNVFNGYRAGSNNTTGNYNTFNGYYTGYSNTTGRYNAFIGSESGYNNTTGTQNVFNGYHSGYKNTTGSYNIFIGSESGYNNTTGKENVFIGTRAGYSNTTGYDNIFSGHYSGYRNTTGNLNVFSGFWSGYNNTTGSNNVFNGHKAGYSNTIGNYNTFTGSSSGRFTTTGDSNSFYGFDAGLYNTTGFDNTFMGAYSGANNTTGVRNSCLGVYSGFNTTIGYQNVYIGGRAGMILTTQYNNTYIGYNAGYQLLGNNNIAIGYNASNTDSNSSINRSNAIYMGNSSITRAFIKVGWRTTSDARDKTDIKDIPYGLDFINKLEPKEFTFDDRSRYEDGKPDGSKKDDVSRLGFLAQDVLAVEDEYPELGHLIADDEDEEHLTITETALIPVLVNALQELSAKVDKLEAELKASKN